MIYASYAHLDLFPETLSEPREYFCETPEKGSPYILFGGRILNMDAITEARLLANLRAHRVPGGIWSISPTAEAICGTAWSASILSPKKNSSPILRSRKKLGGIRRKNSRTTA